MSTAQHEVRIERPIAEVFAFLADGTNNPRWQTRVTQTGTDGPLGEGTTFHQRMRHPLGFSVTADYRISAYEPPRRLVLTVTSGGPIRPTMTYTLRADGASTLVRCTVELHPHGLARLASPALVLLHPLFAWEASWTERLVDLLDPPAARAA
jgi:uncharacterized protein YndB with AHSA1/START domain